MRQLLALGVALVLAVGCGGVTRTGDGDGPPEDGAGGGSSKGGASSASGGAAGGRCAQGVCPPPVGGGACDHEFCPGSELGKGCCVGPNGPCGIDTGNGCGRVPSQRWFQTCGDPVCSTGADPAGLPAPVPREPPWPPPCDPALGQAPGVDCERFGGGALCDARLPCGAYLVCAETDPTVNPGCPR